MKSLFEDGEDAPAPPRRARSRAAAKTDPLAHAAVKRVIDAYHAAYVARFHVAPQINGGKDGALVKKMIKTWGDERVLALLEEFVRGDEPWAVRRGWTLAAFYEVAPRLLTKRSGTNGRTSANVAAAYKATGR